jgi:hypothetical protein
MYSDLSHDFSRRNLAEPLGSGENRSRGERGTNTTPGSVGDMGNVPEPHRCRLTRASTSRKVAVDVRDQAAWATGICPSGYHACPPRVTRRERPQSRGVERAPARSDQWRCVSMPPWARRSSPVTSRLQRVMRIAEDRFCRLGGVGGTDGGGRPRARWIASQHPSDREGSGTRAGPQRRARAALPGAFPLARPVSSELLPDRVRVLPDLF